MAGLQARAGAWGARDEGGGGLPRGAKRRKCRIISLAAGGTQVGNCDLASASLQKWAACGGRCPDSRKNGIPDAGFGFVFRRGLPARVVQPPGALPSREARVGFHSGRRSAVLAPVGNVLPPMGRGRSASGTAQGCRRGIVRPLRGSAA